MVVAVGNSMRISLESFVDDSYWTVFGQNLFPKIAKDLAKRGLGSKYAIITDSNVEGLYGDALKNALESAGLEAGIFSFPAGEKSKNISVCLSLMERMRELHYGIDSAVIALGGGVVGDMAGFIAATHLRGIPCEQVPTTTLAQADSSIGGKTAVNTIDLKNSIGAFKWPAKVWIDVATLQTQKEQDKRNYVSGFAEAVKHGVIMDAAFFAYLEAHMKEILECDPKTMLYVAKQNCRIKGTVVEHDPKERGLRRILNYGHTVGHAIELQSGFELPHGECVAIGMMVAGRIAIALDYFSESELEQQERMLAKFGLPTRLPRNISDNSIIQSTMVDKKAKGGAVRYALPAGLGRMREFGGVYATPVEEGVVRSALKATR